MGININYGIRFDGDINDVVKIINSFRPYIEKETLRLEGEYIGKELAYLIDNAAINDAPLKDKPWNIVMEELRKDKKDLKTGIRKPRIDFEFQVAVIIGYDAIYGVVYTEQNEWFKEFISLDGVNHYHYYSGEEPEGISRAEWELRSAQWDILVPTGIVKDVCLKADLSLGDLRWINPDDVTFPSVEDRIQYRARDRLMTEYYRDNKKDDEEIFGSTFFEADRYSRDENRVAAMVDKIRDKIVPLTMEYVRNINPEP